MNIDNDILLTWGATIKKYNKGEIIFEEGNEARFFYQIMTGEVKMFNLNQDCREFTQGVFKEGNSFGEPPLFINEPYPASAITTKESVLIKLSKEQFLKILDEYPKLQRLFLNEFAKRIYIKSITARDNINNPPDLRILGLLNSLKNKDLSGMEKVLVPHTRQEIANLTGLRVETVIRTLKKLHAQKKVEIVKHKLYH